MRPLKNIQPEEDFAEENHNRSALSEVTVLLITATAIVSFGLVVLYSTSFGTAGMSYFKKQFLWMAIGTCGFFTVILFGYKRLSDLSPWLMLGVIGMLIWALTETPVNGALRWIRIMGGKITIQPSEFAKLIIVLFLAKFLSERTRLIESHPFRIFCQSGLLCAPVIALVLCGRDLGTTVLLSVVFLAVLFAAGVRQRYILPWVFICPPALFFLVKYFDPVRYARITTFLNPEATSSEEGYQLWLSLLALGSGSWSGMGFAESRLKMKYLPEAHTDFILSVVGEELGFVCLCLVILAYIVFIICALGISCKARTRQGMLIAFGVMTFIAVQAIINIGVITGGFPTKGMPAPFISYGGSSMITCITATGFIVSVALDNIWPDYQDNILKKLKEKLASVGALIYRKN